MSNYFVIDLGGTFVKYGVLNEDAEILFKDKTPTEKSSLEGLYNQLKTLVTAHKDEYEIVGVSISSPGSVNPQTKIIHGTSAFDFIHENEWVLDLEKEIGLPIEIENDANCAALAEALFGNGKDESSMISIVIGTGIGGAIVIDKKIFAGNSFYAGEFGYPFVDITNPEKTVSSHVSTIALLKKVQKIRDVKNGIEVYKLYDEKDEEVVEIVEQYYLELAGLIYNLNHIINPGVVLIGGGVSERKDFISKIEEKYKYLQSITDMKTIDFNVNTCKFFNDSNLIGALANYFIQTQNK